MGLSGTDSLLPALGPEVGRAASLKSMTGCVILFSVSKPWFPHSIIIHVFSLPAPLVFPPHSSSCLKTPPDSDGCQPGQVSLSREAHSGHLSLTHTIQPLCPGAAARHRSSEGIARTPTVSGPWASGNVGAQEWWPELSSRYRPGALQSLLGRSFHPG